MQGYARATNTTVPRPSPKDHKFSASQTIGRYGDYGNFDIMFGGDGQPEDPHDPSYSYADLFAAPGDMCVDAGVLAELSRADEAGVLPSLPNCSKTEPCTVPCSTPHSRKWFAHFDRMQGQTDSFAYDKQTWSNKTWAHPERGVVRFLASPQAIRQLLVISGSVLRDCLCITGRSRLGLTHLPAGQDGSERRHDRAGRWRLAVC